MRSYYTNANKTEMAFCMPINQDFNPNFKIVRQKQNNRDALFRLIDKNFRTEEEAQEKLDKIAKKKGWEKAFEG